MRKWLIVSGVLIAMIFAAATVDVTRKIPSPEQVTRSYIVQASDLDRARSVVIGVGGVITHELGIIKAVGAKLTAQQVERVRTTEGVTRVYEDRKVETSTTTLASATPDYCDAAVAEQLAFDSDDIFWTVKNTGDTPLHLARMMVMWPPRNGPLRGIEFNNQRVFSGSVRGVSAGFDADQFVVTSVDEGDSHEPEGLPQKVTFNVGDSVVVEAEFSRIVANQDSYEVRLVFEEGCSLEFPPSPHYAFQGNSDFRAKRTYVSSLVGADALHWQGITGDGVGVAIVDTGLWTTGRRSRYLVADPWGFRRIAAQYDAIAHTEVTENFNSDANGHGSHVASIIASSRYKDSEFNGIAPEVDLVVVKAFDADGKATYLDVIRGLDWVVTNKDAHNVRVLNLSFSASPQSYYWDDPLNQAVMAAWQNGIAVVASAGNGGPAPMTVGVPGNVPYVITVGAMTDSMTPLDWSDDTLASFSATGPTYEAFIKPDLVAPGGHVRGMMGRWGKFATKHPHYHDGDAYFTMSGTSQSAAIVSGAVALLLQAEPWLTPDQVKCKLVSTARSATTDSGEQAYGVFQQGAGMIDVAAAVKGTDYSCANQGLDVAADLAGKAHFQGRAAQDEAGAYYLGNADGHVWHGDADFSSGYVWGGGLPWNDARVWSDGLPWNDVKLLNDGLPWNDVNVLNDGLPWNDIHNRSISTNIWVNQE